MIRKLSLIAALILTFALAGCSSNPATAPQTSDKNTTVAENSNNADVNKDNGKNNNTDIAQKNENTENTKKETNKKDIFSIYTADAETMSIKEISTIELTNSLSLNDKLKELTKALSSKVFEGLPIEVKSIDNIDGKKIATINLNESNANKNITSNSELKKPNWAANKFQGSTGGEISETSLIETLLQVKYKGEWIDGIKFLYKNEPLEFEHTPNLSVIKYRK